MVKEILSPNIVSNKPGPKSQQGRGGFQRRKEKK